MAEIRQFEGVPTSDLDGAIVRITTPHVPLPAADALEDLAIPSVGRIVETVIQSLG